MIAKKLPFIFISLIIVVVFAFLYHALHVNPNAASSALVGKPALGFEVEILQAADMEHVATGTFTLAQFRGRPVILNFWASWCQSCQAEARELEAFWQAYHESSPVVVLGIAIQDEAGPAKEFARKHGKTYPLGLDVSGSASLNYGLSGVPETFFIDAEGIIRDKYAGPISFAMLEERLALILKKG